MNKLQLYVTISLNGHKPVVNYNPSEDVQKYVEDLRHAVETVNYDPNEKNIFYMLRYVNTGAFLVVIRTIPNQPLDHLAAWLYVPNGMAITATELDHVVKTVVRKVSNPRMSEDDLAQLREVFSAEYQIDRQAASMAPSSLTGAYAYCNYAEEGHSLVDLYNKGLFQPSYVPYRGVMMIDGELGLSAQGVDLTDERLADVVDLLPPPANEQGDFAPFIYGQPFDRPYKVALRSTVEVVWRRAGFEDILQEVTVNDDNMQADAVETTASRKTITPDSFSITSQHTHEPISECMVTVNGREITPEGVVFTQAELQSAQVVVSAEGYDHYSARIDLASATRALIQLHERGRIYRFEMPVRSASLGSPLTFEIRTKRRLSNSPIEGYVLQDNMQEGGARINRLVYSAPTQSGTMVYKLIFMAIGLVIGLLIGWLTTCSDNKELAADVADVEQTEATASAVEAGTALPESGVAVPADQAAKEVEQPAQAPAQAQPNTVPVTAEAIAYLDNNKEWKQSDLEAIPSLKGLYNDLNTLNLDAVVNTWGPKLTGSKNFAKLVGFCEGSQRKGVNVHRDNREKFTDKGTIGWYSYSCWVDP